GSFFLKQKTAYDIFSWLEFRRVPFRSPTERGGSAGLGSRGGDVARQEGGLGRVEQDGLGVVELDGVEVGVGEPRVDEREVPVRVLLGRRLDRVLEQVADTEGEVAALLDHGVDVRPELGLRLRLSGLLVDPELVDGGSQALVRGLVEGAVVPAARVGDQARREVRGAAGLAAATPAVLLVLGGGAAGGECEGGGGGHRRRDNALLHGCLHWSMAEGRGLARTRPDRGRMTEGQYAAPRPEGRTAEQEPTSSVT